MNHDAARAIFEEIRDRPYAWTTCVGETAHNCYFKGIELLQRLGILGYAVRGRVGETYIDRVVPEEIRNLHPPFPVTHFWVEVLIDGIWRIKDPSFDPPLSSVGLVVNDWGSDRSCFDITKEYSHQEAIDYQLEWNDAEYSKRYFDAAGPFARALNDWFEQVRRKVDNQ